MADYTLDDVQRMSAGDAGKTYSLQDVAAMRGDPKPAEARRPVQVPGIPGMMFSTALGLMQPEGRAEVGRATLGGVRGAADIGNTVLRAGAWLADKVAPGVAARDRERQQSLDQFFTDRVPPNDPAFLIGRVASNIAGTAGVGLALAAPLRGLVAGSPTATALVNAVGSGGMSTGAPGLGRATDLALRTLGGAATGGASAALVHPESIGTGATIGAVLPGALRVTGKAASATGRQLRNLRVPADARMAREVATMAGVDPFSVDGLAAVRDALRPQGPNLITGAQPTVPQLLQTPELSQLQRSVKTVSPATLANHEASQNAARLDALNRVAPVTGTVQQAAEDAGNAIAGWAGPERVRAGQRVNRLFDAVDPFDETRFLIPTDAMRDAQARFLGPGTFGSGRSARTALETAEAIGTVPAPQGVPGATGLAEDLARLPRPVPFREIQNLRSSIGEAAQAADAKGFAREAAALNGMKREIDARVAAVSRGQGMPGEAFPSDIVASWREALDAHQFKKLQFDTGPQRSMFRMGGDGQASIQGAEIPGKFFNAARSQVEDAQAFRRLVGDNPGLLDDLRRYAVTDAAGQVDRLGNLTSAKFNKWLDARSGASGVIFDPQQRALLKAVSDDLRRADRAESLGRVTGSDTTQKAAGMLRLGLLDSPGTNFAAGKVPGGTALLDFLRGQVRTSRADRLSGLLVDPERTAGLLDAFIAAQRSPAPQGLLSEAVDPLLSRSAPVLLSGWDR
ncbi:hypothetical protein [Pseudorhodoferax sp.]|uniref:hypothetical protein n=1 Tax=Pseudorhodoferax sp. TaxID=1993553 RepID=UPI002DD62182|nr:hypothetical protein [Pseudorhodoferax sp.]